MQYVFNTFESMQDINTHGQIFIQLQTVFQTC